MSILSLDQGKEQQKINQLEQKIKREKEKLDKKVVRKKILLGAFLIEALENNEVKGLRKYVVENLDNFLIRDGDKKLMADVIEKLESKDDYEVVDNDTITTEIDETGFPVDEDNMFTSN